MMFATRVTTLVSCAVALMLPIASQAQSAGMGPKRARTTSQPSADSVVVRASKKYGASGFHRFLLGDNYRDLWYQPIKVPMLDLGRYAGGLKALEEGGNAQTRNLHLRGGDGREYVFRPVFKEVLQMDEMFDGTVVEDIFADGLSASHPAATVLPSPLLQAAGVVHASPVLYVMPDDERLGEFRKNFANKLGTIEEFPEDPKEEPGFGGAVDIIDSDDLLEQLNQDGPPIIDAHALLTARLMDLLIGDNDRHPGQWKWAKMRNAANARWVPIPRDRDKAFVSYEGVMLKAARIFLPRLVSFKTQPHAAMFYNAVDFDRRLLVPVERKDFDSTAKFLVSVITDSVINEAVHSMPAEYQKIEPELTSRVKGRRDNLVVSAADYYHALFTVVDLHGTKGNDRATIVRQRDGSVSIRLEAGGVTYLDRAFDPVVTKEVRLYLNDGDDVATITGDVPASIPLWIVGGKGRNHLVDSSRVGGRINARLYDNGDAGPPNVVADDQGNGRSTERKESGNSAVDTKPAQDTTKAGKNAGDAKKDSTEGTKDTPRAKKDSSEAKKRLAAKGYDPDTAWNPRPYVDFQGYEVPPFRDRGTSLKPMAGISFGQGYGVKPSISVTRRKYGFRQYPYASKTRLELAYGTATQGWALELATDNRIESSRMFLATESALTQLMTGRFAGFGNDATLPSGTVDDVNQGQWYFKPAIGWALSPVTEFKIGPVVKFTNTDSTPGTVVAETRPYGFSRFGVAGVELSLVHESRRKVVSHGGTADELLADDHPHALDFEVRAAAYPAIWDATSAFGTLSAITSGYITLSLPLQPVLAARLGGQSNFGNFPYFESAFLGGSESVRTLHRQQYAGDLSLFGSLELRVPLAEFPFILPLNLGLIGFADGGRVYMDGESPGGWHSGLGGGFWLGTMQPSTNINVTFTNNPDRKVLIATGFVF
jgi:hypothetical protein